MTRERDGAGRCPGCGLAGSHDVLAECWAALAEHDRLEGLWEQAPDPADLAPVGADLPTRRALRWLRDNDRTVWPLAGTPPGDTEPPDVEGFYARAGAVRRLRRRFHRGPIADGVVVERLAESDGWLAVRRACHAGTLVPRDCLGRADPAVRVFELVVPPSGGDPATLAADRVLLQRAGEQFADDLLAHDGWTGERVGVAPDPGAVPAEVERTLRAEMTATLL